MKITLALAALITLCANVLPGAGDDSETLQRGREFTARFYEREIESLWSDFAEALQAGLGSMDALGGFRGQLDEQLGPEVQVIDETVRSSGNDGEIEVYTRTARFEKLDTPINVVWSFDGEGHAAGFTISPVRIEAPSEYLKYETKTALRLPFEGQWFIFWGGRSLDQNYHAFTTDQRFAYDILIMRDGSSHTGEGEQNSDYHCYGKPVLAPGKGVVVAAGDGVADNVPGEMNPAEALGNHVIIDHGNGEFSLLAHFQNGSVAVEAGDEVESGDRLGLCGNSGNTTEPHIHYHLQDTPDFGQGHGMPAQFLDYEADGEVVERGEPVRGQSVSPR
jgi:murein DD-endopeptidase MepM/ murein hydrolase activator NlpD